MTTIDEFEGGNHGERNACTVREAEMRDALLPQQGSLTESLCGNLDRWQVRGRIRDGRGVEGGGRGGIKSAFIFYVEMRRLRWLARDASVVNNGRTLES